MFCADEHQQRKGLKSYVFGNEIKKDRNGNLFDAFKIQVKS